MKTKFILVISSACLLFAACSNKDDKPYFVKPDREQSFRYTYCNDSYYYLVEMHLYYQQNGITQDVIKPLDNTITLGYSSSSHDEYQPFWCGGEIYCDSVAVSNGSKRLVFRRKDNDKIFSRSNYVHEQGYYKWSFTDEDFENGTPVETDRADE